MKVENYMLMILRVEFNGLMVNQPIKRSGGVFSNNGWMRIGLRTLVVPVLLSYNARNTYVKNWYLHHILENWLLAVVSFAAYWLSIAYAEGRF